MHLFRSGALILLWASIFLLTFYFFFDNVVAYFYGYSSPMFGHSFFRNQLWIVMHMKEGSLTLALGYFLFWSFVLTSFTKFQRTAGKHYMLDILLIGISAGWILQTYPHRKKANYLTALVRS